MAEILGVRIIEAKKQSDRAEARFVTCSVPGGDCPLLKQKKCLHATIFGCCVYGGGNVKRTATKRSKTYYKDLGILREEAEKHPKLPEGAYQTGVLLLGDYYYLPYSHMDMCESVPFVKRSAFIVSGVPFVKKEDFTPECVVALATFSPMALFGGEITQYQQEEVPKFLFHLKYRFPELYEAASALNPVIQSKTINIDDVKKLNATMDCIPAGITGGYHLENRGQVQIISWDGTTLKIKGPSRQMPVVLLTVDGSECELMFNPRHGKVSIV
ncbi:MAG: hypothetical protein WC341_17275, partial [Bacteroidales bacterium]